MKKKFLITEEEKGLKERMSHVLNLKGLKIKDLSETKSGQVMVGKQLDQATETTVQYKTIYKLLYMCHDIDANWLVMGEGTMQKADHLAPRIYTQHNEVKGNSAGGDINVGPDSVISKKTVERLQSQIADLTARIMELQKDKENMQMLIDQLKK